MSKHLLELSQAEASSASDSESNNGVYIPGAENSNSLSDDDESLILSTDGKSKILTISNNKRIENLSWRKVERRLKSFTKLLRSKDFNFLVAIALEDKSIGPKMSVNGSSLSFFLKSSLSLVILT